MFYNTSPPPSLQPRLQVYALSLPKQSGLQPTLECLMFYNTSPTLFTAQTAGIRTYYIALLHYYYYYITIIHYCQLETILESSIALCFAIIPAEVIYSSRTKMNKVSCSQNYPNATTSTSNWSTIGGILKQCTLTSFQSFCNSRFDGQRSFKILRVSLIITSLFLESLNFIPSSKYTCVFDRSAQRRPQ